MIKEYKPLPERIIFFIADILDYILDGTIDNVFAFITLTAIFTLGIIFGINKLIGLIISFLGNKSKMINDLIIHILDYLV